MSERGVKETKEVLAFVFSMTNAIKVSLADGDFDFWDAKNFVEPLKKIAPAVENIEEVLPELEDLSLDEVIELTQINSGLFILLVYDGNHLLSSKKVIINR